MSERLSEALDKEDPIPHLYFWMCHLGAERPLKKEKDFQQAVGKQVAIKTYEPIDGEKMFEGKMLSYDGTTITLLLTIKTRKKKSKFQWTKLQMRDLLLRFS